MVSQAGWRVERVTLTPGDDGVREEVFRVSWRGYWQADCTSTAEVARHVDLATLVPTGWGHVRSPEYLAKVGKAEAWRRLDLMQQSTRRTSTTRWGGRG